MALAGFSKSPVAAAASLLVALTGFAAVAGTPGFAVTETIVGTGGTTSQSKSLAPNATAVVTVIVTRSNPDETRPGLLTLKFTLPSGVDFVSVTNCTLPDNFDPTTSTPTCTISDPFKFTATPPPGAFGTNVKATITVRRHFDPAAPVPTSCPTASLGVVTVQATTDVGDNLTASPAVTLNVKPYADIDVTATAPATANRGDTISVVGTIKNHGPCDATNVEIDPESSNAAGVTLLTFKSISGACTVTVDANTGAPTPGKDGSCIIASLPVGASTTITKTYTVDNTNVNGQTQTTRTSGYANGGADQADPVAGNDVGDTTTVVPNDSGGCNSGGAVGPVALLGLMLAFSRKRRTA
jgi:Domain of unknown function DUF11